MNSYLSKVRGIKFNALDLLSEICIFIFPVAHYLCSGLGWSMVWNIVSLFTLGVGVLNVITQKRIRLHGYELWIVIFFMCCFLSTALSFYVDQSLASLINQIKMIVYCILFMFVVMQKRKYMRHCFLHIFLAAISVSVITIVNTDVDALLTVDTKYLSGLRVGLSAAENVNITAFNMAVGFAISSLYMSAYTDKSNKVKQTLIRVGQIVILLGIFFTGTRKALLSCALVVAFEFIDLKKTRKLIAGLALFALAMYLVMETPLLYRLVGARIESFIMGTMDASDMIRISLAEEAKAVFFDYPIIGVGLDQFKLYSSHAIYAHNNMLEILADFGILGFVAYYSIFVVILYKLMHTVFHYRERTAVFGVVAAYFSMEFSQVSYQLLTGALFLSLICVFLDYHARGSCRHRIQ